MAASERLAAAKTPVEMTRRHKEVLDLYFGNPNAAAVARETGFDERTVRRIRDAHKGYLDERWRVRDEELETRADARRSRVLEWADAGLDRAMAEIDALLEDDNPSVRLRAAKVKIDLALRGGGRAGRQQLAGLDALNSARISEIEAEIASAGRGSARGAG